KLDTNAVMSPKIVLNHKTGLEEIFTQDLNDNIYLISNTGKILWKKRLDGRIKSDIFQIDFFQNNKLQFLFNTEKAIYLIDRNGNYVQGYPLQLPVAATNGINVFDYEKNRDYRIVYSGADKKIYIYKASGKLVEGFDFKGTEDSVTVPLQWERINFKDYLIAFDKGGAVYGLGRKGENRLSVSEKIPIKNYGYNIQYGKDIDKTKFCFYDVAAKKMVKVFLNNKKEEFLVSTELEDAASFVCKINDDDNFDLVLVKGKNIEIYDDRGSLIQKVETATELKPFFRQLQKNNETYYAFIDKENNLLIFSANWQEPEKSTAKCSQLPAIEMLNDDGYFYLIGIHNDLVSCYPF
ncbi:MAG: hypothetical protein IAF38_21345, partial [Bacteroidia bacterium]|nr:hypothetical protein [Bacteroidia bacterium]